MRASIPVLFAAALFVGCHGDEVTVKDLVTGSWEVNEVSVQYEVFLCSQSLKECIVHSGYTEQEAQSVIAQNLQKPLIVHRFTSIEFKSDGTWIGNGVRPVTGTWKLAPDSKIVVTSDEIPGFEETAFMSYVTSNELHLVDYIDGKYGSKTTKFQVELDLRK